MVTQVLLQLWLPLRKLLALHIQTPLTEEHLCSLCEDCQRRRFLRRAPQCFAFTSRICLGNCIFGNLKAGSQYVAKTCDGMQRCRDVIFGRIAVNRNCFYSERQLATLHSFLRLFHVLLCVGWPQSVASQVLATYCKTSLKVPLYYFQFKGFPLCLPRYD